MRITVKPSHIKKGVRGNPCECPIALALKEATETRWRVTAVTAMQTGTWEVFDLPKKCETFVKRFDACEPVQPFSFEPPIP